MKKRIVQSLLLIIFCISLITPTISKEKEEQIEITQNNTLPMQPPKLIEVSIEKTETSIVGQTQSTDEQIEKLEILSEPLVFPNTYFNPETEEYNEEEFWDDMELVALVCVAEAEGETEKGKRLVIDTIFNRLDSPHFPNTIHDVIYQRNPEQYSCVWNGRINKVEYDEYIASLVLEEFNNRTNDEIVYFKTKGYFSFGEPVLNEGSHFFSKR